MSSNYPLLSSCELTEVKVVPLAYNSSLRLDGPPEPSPLAAFYYCLCYLFFFCICWEKSIRRLLFIKLCLLNALVA